MNKIINNMIKKIMKLKIKDIIRYLGLVLLVLVFINSIQIIYENKPLIEGFFGKKDGGDEDDDENDDEEEEDSEDEEDDEDEEDEEDDFSGKEKKRLKKVVRFIDKKMKGKKFKEKYNKELKMYAKIYAKEPPKKGKKMAQSLLNGFALCAKGVSTALKKASGKKTGGYF